MREVARAVLEALDRLHSALPPLIHGCVKPNEVLFMADGAAKLAFGLEQRLKLSKAAEQGGHAQRFAAKDCRTPTEEDRREQPSSDIYDLGLLLLVSALGGWDVLHQ